MPVQHLWCIAVFAILPSKPTHVATGQYFSLPWWSHGSGWPSHLAVVVVVSYSSVAFHRCLVISSFFVVHLLAQSHCAHSFLLLFLSFRRTTVSELVTSATHSLLLSWCCCSGGGAVVFYLACLPIVRRLPTTETIVVITITVSSSSATGKWFRRDEHQYDEHPSGDTLSSTWHCSPPNGPFSRVQQQQRECTLSRVSSPCRCPAPSWKRPSADINKAETHVLAIVVACLLWRRQRVLSTSGRILWAVCTLQGVTQVYDPLVRMPVRVCIH